MTATTERAVHIGDRRIPVVLPDRRDARLHTAGVIVSVHIIGITALGFRVSVPQILVSIATAGLIDVALTFRRTGKLVWPASGMLTGSGVALILRLVGMDAGDPWSWAGWHWFALVAGVSISTKYLIRWRGDHVFNPSNVGLVLAFLILGSDVVEPLDFWWAPLGLWMGAAYVVIVAGGIAVTYRLRLFEMALVFWAALAAGLAVLAASGHCLTTAWSPTPVCDGRFWTVLVTSPEVLVFLFFMITDPKTIPGGRRARFAFAASLGVFATLMIAPHTVEFGAKVGLLSSLAIWSPLRGVFERMLPDLGASRSGLGEIIDRIRSTAPAVAFAKGLVAGSLAVVLAGLVFVAGVPARQPAQARSGMEAEVSIEVDMSDVPAVTADPSLDRLDLKVDQALVDEVTMTFLENLALESEAVRLADGSLLGIADGGERLDEMQARLDEAIAVGERRAEEYRFETLTLRLHEAGAGQTSAGLSFDGKGLVDHITYDAVGVEQARTTSGFETTFVLRQLAGERWRIVSVEVTTG
jgi:hypothetical protein